MHPIYIFDLDGTLADNSHRLHYINQEQKDWKSYYAACGDDKPIWGVIKVLQALQKDNDVWIWSGRSEEVKDQTISWLWRYGILEGHGVNYWLHNGTTLRMRKENDHMKNAELKKAWYYEVFISTAAGSEGLMKRLNRVNLLGVFEDHPEAATMWRSLGVTVFELESRS